MHHKMPEEQLNQMKYESSQFVSTKDIFSFRDGLCIHGSQPYIVNNYCS